MGGVESICLGRISTWGAQLPAKRADWALVRGVHRIQRAGPLAGFARGKCPLPERKIAFCEPNMHNFRPFLVWISEIYDFWWSQGAVLLFLKECVFRNHKCTILVPFLSKFIRRPIYNFGGRKGAVPPCLRKFCILRAKIASFQALFV